MTPKFTTWTVDEFAYAVERMYEKPVSKERRPLAGSLATSISEQRQIPIERIYSGDDDDAVDARRSLCRQLMLHGWTPWRIAERLAMPWDVVAEACDADGPVEALEYQETLTKRRMRPWAAHLRQVITAPLPLGSCHWVKVDHDEGRGWVDGKEVPVERQGYGSPVLKRVGLRLVEPYDAGHRGLGPQRAYHGTADVEGGSNGKDEERDECAESSAGAGGHTVCHRRGGSCSGLHEVSRDDGFGRGRLRVSDERGHQSGQCIDHDAARHKAEEGARQEGQEVFQEEAIIVGTVPPVPSMTREEAREAYPHLVTEAAMIDPRFARGIRIPDLQPDGPAYTYIDWDKAPRKPRKRPFVIDAKLPTKHRSKPLVASVQERAVTKIRKAKVSK